MASPPPPPPAVEKGVSPQLLRAIVERESIPIQNGEYGLPIKAEEAATKFNIDFKNLNELGQLAIYIPALIKPFTQGPQTNQLRLLLTQEAR